MKKVVSLILVMVVITLGMCAFASDSEVIKMLGEYDVFVGDEGGMRLEDKLTRGEFFKMLAVASGYVGGAMDFEFADLNKNDWEYPYVCYLKMFSAEVADENGNVNVKGEIEYAECLKHTLKILGYETSENYVGNMMTATNTGLTKGLAYSADTPVIRKHAVILMKNALDIPLRAIRSYSSDGEKTYELLDGKDGRGYRTLKTNLDEYKGL